MSTITIALDDAIKLNEFLAEKNKTNWGLWGDPKSWLDVGVPYELTSVCYPNRAGKMSDIPCTIIEFDEVVRIGKKRGKRFGFGNLPRNGDVHLISNYAPDFAEENWQDEVD